MEPFALETTARRPAAEVGIPNHEAGVGVVRLKAAGIVEWVSDGEAESASRFKHPRCLANGGGHVRDVHQRVVGDDQVEAAIGKWQLGGVSQFVATVRVGFPCVSKQRGRTVNANDAVAALL